MRIILFLFLINCSIQAQSIFNVDFDVARFDMSDSTSRLEIYYSFYHEGMTTQVVKNDSIIRGAILVKIKAEGQEKDQYLVNKIYNFSSKTNSKNRATLGILKYVLLEGSYLCELKGSDMNQENSIDSVSFIFTINGFKEDKYSISDIQFASSLKRSVPDSKSIFKKFNYEVIPNTSGIYGEHLPVLFFYSELYNLNKGSVSPFLDLSYTIQNQNSEIVFSKAKKLNTKLTSIIFTEAINVSKYVTGSYSLTIQISEKNSNSLEKKIKRFTVVNPNIVDTAKTITDKAVFSSEFAEMTMDELNKAFNTVKYISQKREIDTWKLLKRKAEKRNFLYSFWKRRDKDSDPNINKTKIEYYNRVDIASKRFETMQKEGWETERGRVYCIFGEPDEIERYPNENELAPYEIWNYYDVEGGVIFVFGELFGFTDMTLIHSSKNGEIFDPSWRAKLQR